ncbi:hypothetical protein GALMADRAFT_273898 [Galerina marginata CBS 339.88]|uniref:Secreted protein n=1 Tax=Galerina marginata (strain CBS 339.88) TaxID=685588 RepID=A0A067SD52_GALM3|nr:hypothetical protein GALMADRAFT_273898 [Galerina marginata CBS 339.88]
MTFKYLVLCLLSGARLASALPASKIAGSADIKHVIKHTHEDSYYHGDLASIYPRASGCSPLTLEQLKQLPGWSKIQQYAPDTYGGGGVNIVVNPSEYPDRPAVVCLKAGVVPIQVQGAPSCTSTSSQMDNFSTTASDQTTQTITYNVADGQKCLGTITTKTGNVQGKGSVVTGYVWFNFDDAVCTNFIIQRW